MESVVFCPFAITTPIKMTNNAPAYAQRVRQALTYLLNLTLITTEKHLSLLSRLRQKKSAARITALLITIQR